MDVIKSDGTREDYSSSKVWDTVCDAFKTAGEPCIPAVIDAIVANLYVYDKVSTSEIRRQVEDGLMSVNKKVAKAYIERYKSDMELKDKDDFIRQYIKASNAATGSKYDPNANVAHKNIVTMGGELYKGNAIRLNRYVMRSKLKALYGKRMANQYIEDIESHVLYKHDETGIPGMPYCVAITMYPFLTDGLVNLGGPSKPPTDLKSFCGEFINLVYSVSSQFLGAVATPEFLLYMDYFIRRDYGDDYINRLDDVVDLSRKRRTLESVIENCFQQVVHSMNMPAGTRGYQSVFWNVGYFDSNYFKGVFEDFVFPDGTKPKWETLSWLQKKFMKWFNEERTKYTLTFPVESMALLTDGEDVIDTEYADFTSEMWAEGHSFFCYLSDSADSLASCCRLRNSLKDLEDTEHNHTVHQYSMGTASVSTGSKSVMTINLNRVVQDSVRKFAKEKLNEDLVNGEQFIPNSPEELDEVLAYISKSVEEITFRVHKYQHAFNEVVKDYLKASMLDVYSAGFIDIKRQYLTVGLNGFTDAAEFLGIDAKPCEEYRKFANSILETINKCNAASRTKELMFNTEFVPQNASGDVKPALIDLEPLRGNRRQQGASVMAA